MVGNLENDVCVLVCTHLFSLMSALPMSSNPAHYIKIFVNKKQNLMTFLEHQIQVQVKHFERKRKEGREGRRGGRRGGREGEEKG